MQAEFDKIWHFQQQFYPEILTDELKIKFDKTVTKNGKTEKYKANEGETWKILETPWNLVGKKRTTKGEELKKENYIWRVDALSKKMDLEKLVVVLQKIHIDYNKSSGYLGAISDRSKELFFYKIIKFDGTERPQTVGEYQMSVLSESPNASLRNMVFYRQDYLDEFNTIWETQARFHKELTEELKQKIRDVVIFYQRRLKSQKGLISFCEFENNLTEYREDFVLIKKCQFVNFKDKVINILDQFDKRIKIENDLVESFFEDLSIESSLSIIEFKERLSIDSNENLFYRKGQRVIPRSSPLFQEFKIWQCLNDIEIFPVNEKRKKRKPNARRLNQEQKDLLFTELTIREKLSKDKVLTLLDLQEFDMNFNSIEGNRTQAELFKKYQEIFELPDLKDSADKIIETIKENFIERSYKTDILHFNADVENLGDEAFYNLWHLLYSFEGDNSNTGNENLITKLMSEYGFDKPAASILANITFQDDYGSLSTKAIRKILPRMKQGEDYTTACAYAYRKHSKNSLTTEELDKKIYKNKLEILPKNSLRNPVVEKILNQMINVINEIIDNYGVKNEKGEIIEKPFNEIRIELARELKKSANERILLSDSVNTNTEEIKKIKETLKDEFNLSNPSRNDIIRYKLWKELAPNGHKTLYSNIEISPAKLFTKEIEIEHIIPKSRLFDDSFSNKTLEFHDVNHPKTGKGDKTAIDFVKEKYGEQGLREYVKRIISVYGTKTTKRVNKRTKKIETETKTFDSFKKEHIRSLKKKEQKSKWDNLSETEQNLVIIEKYYSGKLGKLAMSEKDLPDGFINRDLANTQYITKEAKKILGDLVKFVVCTTGSITERLREDWQLVDVMKEINFPKYEQLGLVEDEERIDYETGEIRYVKKIKDWTKRNDHRHHAMDALAVAFTKRQFIQYLNNLNARRADDNLTISNTEKEEIDNFAITTEDAVLNTRDVLGIERNYLYRDKRNKLRFNPPIPLNEFRAEAKKHLENTLISIKAKNKVVTNNINTTKKTGGVNKKLQSTPRGQLHDQTVYGKNDWSRIALSKKISKKEIDAIRSPELKKFISEYIKEKGSIAKAFSDNELLKLSFKGKPLKEVVVNIPCYTQRINISKIFTDSQKTNSAKEKLIDNILDLKIRDILRKRVNDFDKDFKKAFSNLDENPIWFNEEKGIAIKRVITTGISNAEALHDKKDKDGNLILDENGQKQPVDFVNTGNNHHVAVYRDENGNLQENVVSFFEATSRANLGLPIIDKDYKKSEGWQFLFSMKQNEYFVFPNEKTGFNPKEIDLLNPENYALISPNLFRVQKFAFKNYVFRHHLETSIKDTSNILKGITWTDFRSSKGLDAIVKVRINHIGEIISVGEY